MKISRNVKCIIKAGYVDEISKKVHERSTMILAASNFIVTKKRFGTVIEFSLSPSFLTTNIS